MAGTLSITANQLAEHNTDRDVWLAIRGKVYNVTSYLPFHPGGAQELMKGAGKDATSLFNQVSSFTGVFSRHRYDNDACKVEGVKSTHPAFM